MTKLTWQTYSFSGNRNFRCKYRNILNPLNTVLCFTFLNEKIKNIPSFFYHFPCISRAVGTLKDARVPTSVEGTPFPPGVSVPAPAPGSLL